MKRALYVIFILCGFQAGAKIEMKSVQYKQGDANLEGFLVYDSDLVAKNKKLPGVVVVHNWLGVGDYVKMRAEQMAGLGYAAFVADIYGKADTPKDQSQAGKMAGKYKGDLKLMRARATAAYDELKKATFVDVKKIGAMGYCFGGTTVLEMARAGLPLTGVVSFHGGLATGNPNDAKNIKSKVLALHGALDPFVPPPEVAAFQKEMNEANVDYQFVSYSGAVHAFTEKAVGSDIKSGAAYNENADKRSFIAMKNFFDEVNR